MRAGVVLQSRGRSSRRNERNRIDNRLRTSERRDRCLRERRWTRENMHMHTHTYMRTHMHMHRTRCSAVCAGVPAQNAYPSCRAAYCDKSARIMRGQGAAFSAIPGAGCQMVQPTSSEMLPMRGGIRCRRRYKRLWHSRGRRQSHRWMSRQMRHSGHARRVAGTDAGWRAPMASAGASANASGSASDASFRYANASTCRCRAKGRNPKHYGALHPPDTNYACLSVPARMSRSRRGHTGQQLFQGSGIDRLDHVRREPGFLRHPHLVVLPPA